MVRPLLEGRGQTLENGGTVERKGTPERSVCLPLYRSTAPPLHRYSIAPPFFVCGTPSTIHFGAGVPFK